MTLMPIKSEALNAPSNSDPMYTSGYQFFNQTSAQYEFLHRTATQEPPPAASPSKPQLLIVARTSAPAKSPPPSPVAAPVSNVRPLTITSTQTLPSVIGCDVEYKYRAANDDHPSNRGPLSGISPNSTISSVGNLNTVNTSVVSNPFAPTEPAGAATGTYRSEPNTATIQPDERYSFSGPERQQAQNVPSNQAGRVSFVAGKKLPSVIVYSDGRKCEFEFDLNNSLIRLTEPTGAQWTRLSAPDGEGMALWASNEGHEQVCSIVVGMDGSYDIIDRDQIETSVSATGNASVRRPQHLSHNRVSALIKIFEHADTDGDALLSLAELERAIEKPGISREDLELLMSLRSTYAAIQWHKRGTFESQYTGVSLAEILDFKIGKDASRAIERRLPEATLKQAEDLFSECDVQMQGSLTADQLQQAQKVTSIGSQLRKLVEWMVARVGSLKHYQDYGFDSEAAVITRSSFRAFLLDHFHIEQSSGSRVKPSVSADGINCEYPLYANPRERMASIVMEAVGNGITGDGIFLACLAALVRNSPHTVLQMIKELDDGSYIVVFPGDPSRPVRVMPPSFAELKDYLKPLQFGVWAVVLEKAYRLYQSQWQQSALKPAHEMIELITGQPGNWYPLADVQLAELQQFLHKTLKERRLVCLGGWPHVSSSGNSIFDHTYTVIGFDSDTSMVVLRNPYGSLWQDGTRTGAVQENILSIRLGELKERFAVLFFEARWA